jgi:hypothetical protein
MMINKWLNNYFSSIGTDIANSVQNSNVVVPGNPNTPVFFINNTGPVHVIDVVNAMHSKSSCDSNHIKFIKLRYPLLIYSNVVLNSVYFLINLKQAEWSRYLNKAIKGVATTIG